MHHCITYALLLHTLFPIIHTSTQPLTFTPFCNPLITLHNPFQSPHTPSLLIIPSNPFTPLHNPPKAIHTSHLKRVIKICSLLILIPHISTPLTFIQFLQLLTLYKSFWCWKKSCTMRTFCVRGGTLTEHLAKNALQTHRNGATIKRTSTPRLITFGRSVLPLKSQILAII